MSNEILNTTEFLDLCSKEYVSRMDMLNFIKRTTSLEEDSLLLFLQELGRFCNNLLFETTIEREDCGAKYSEFVTYSISSYLKHYLFKLIEDANTSEDSIKAIEDSISSVNIRTKITVMNILIPNFDSKSNIRFSSLADIYDLAIKEYIIKTQLKPERKEKVPISFSELFMPIYRPYIETLYSILVKNGYINSAHTWNYSFENEPAKVYKYLNQKKVFRTRPEATGLRIFCKEFGINAYSDNDTKPTDGTRKVSMRNLTAADINNEDEKRYDSQFYSFINQN